MRSRSALAAIALLGAGCAEQETQRTLPSVQLAMDETVVASYDDEQTQIYEVRRQVPLPVLAPSAEEASDLAAQSPPPFERMPWVTTDDLRVQLGYTLTNLDDRPHVVEVLIDPWNEFASYYPGLMVADANEGEYVPNLSGLHLRFWLAPRSAGERSRLHGVFTFDEMHELAQDFATVMNLIENPPAAVSGAEDPDNALIVYVNHTFANPSTRDVLSRHHVPAVIPALTGFDLGLRTSEPAKVAIEVVAEVVDQGSEKLETDGNRGALLPPPAAVITVGTVP